MSSCALQKEHFCWVSYLSVWMYFLLWFAFKCLQRIAVVQFIFEIVLSGTLCAVLLQPFVGHTKLARVTYVHKKSDLRVQLLDEVQAQWSTNLHLKLLTLIQEVGEFISGIKGIYIYIEICMECFLVWNCGRMDGNGNFVFHTQRLCKQKARTSFMCVLTNKCLSFAPYSRWENNGSSSVYDTQHVKFQLVFNPCCVFSTMIWIILLTVFTLQPFQLYLVSSMYTSPGSIILCTRAWIYRWRVKWDLESQFHLDTVWILLQVCMFALIVYLHEGVS